MMTYNLKDTELCKIITTNVSHKIVSNNYNLHSFSQYGEKLIGDIQQNCIKIKFLPPFTKRKIK